MQLASCRWPNIHPSRMLNTDIINKFDTVSLPLDQELNFHLWMKPDPCIPWAASTMNVTISEDFSCSEVGADFIIAAYK